MEIISQLEADPMCQSLSLHSFLMLPMQRITRMPLLIDAVISRMNPTADAAEYKTYQITLATINKVLTDFHSNTCLGWNLLTLGFADCERMQRNG